MQTRRFRACLIVLLVAMYAVYATEPVLDIVGKEAYSENNRLMNVHVAWKDVVFKSAEDFVGVYPCLDAECNIPVVFTKVPVQYKPTKDAQKIIPFRIERSLSSMMLRRTPPNPRNILNFTIIVRADVPAYVLAYVTGTWQYPEVAAVTKPIAIPSSIRFQPRNVRLSLVSNVRDQMRVMWTLPSSDMAKLDSYVVLWNTLSRESVRKFDLSQKHSFNASDLCEPRLYPAASVGYVSLGVQLETTLQNLKPGTEYSYKVINVHRGSELESEEYTFRMPGGNPDKSINMIVFGDMGQSMAQIDGSLQHSFDNHNHGELGAPSTEKLLEDMISQKKIDVINHIGDISYATGQLSLWDTFMHMIEPVSSVVPWMTAIGNHEQGWAKSDVEGSDSQGECGVPYLSLFPFSQTKIKEKLLPYYSYTVGNVYVVICSTEHDLTPGSPQLAWIEEALKNKPASVDWTLFLGHRPMYLCDKYEDTPMRHLRRFVEPLLVEYGVDIAMWGHHHSHQRMKCKVNAANCAEKGEKGVWHIVSGHAGFDHSPISKGSPLEGLFAVLDNENWGVSLLEFKNKTHCRVSYVENQQHEEIDHFWVTK